MTTKRTPEWCTSNFCNGKLFDEDKVDACGCCGCEEMNPDYPDCVACLSTCPK